MRALRCGRCAHPRGTHRPYLAGADRPGWCADPACQCWQYIPGRPLLLLLRRLRRARPRHATSPAPPPVIPERPVPCPPLPGPEAYNGETILDWPPMRARPYVPGPRREADG